MARSSSPSDRVATTTAADQPDRPQTSFLRRVLADPAGMGAIVPTGASLARRLARLVPRDISVRVLELGAGTGAISAAIGPRLAPGSVHVALERDPGLLPEVARAAPWALRIAGDAGELESLLATVSLTEIDVVISSLPWSNFSPERQQQILDAICSVMDPHGLFATIAYRPTRLNPASRRFRGLLDASFTQVTSSTTTWGNVPPARLIVARGLLPRGLP